MHIGEENLNMPVTQEIVGSSPISVARSEAREIELHGLHLFTIPKDEHQ
jgi:hypothetical protein